MMMEVLLNERASTERPAYTSCYEVAVGNKLAYEGGLHAYRHKHAVIRGRFKLQINYYKHRRIY